VVTLSETSALPRRPMRTRFSRASDEERGPRVISALTASRLPAGAKTRTRSRPVRSTRWPLLSTSRARVRTVAAFAAGAAAAPVAATSTAGNTYLLSPRLFIDGALHLPRSGTHDAPSLGASCLLRHPTVA